MMLIKVILNVCLIGIFIAGSLQQALATDDEARPQQIRRNIAEDNINNRPSWWQRNSSKVYYASFVLAAVGARYAYTYFTMATPAPKIIEEDLDTFAICGLNPDNFNNICHIDPLIAQQNFESDKIASYLPAELTDLLKGYTSPWALSELSICLRQVMCAYCNFGYPVEDVDCVTCNSTIISTNVLGCVGPNIIALPSMPW